LIPLEVKENPLLIADKFARCCVDGKSTSLLRNVHLLVMSELWYEVISFLVFIPYL